MQRKNKAQVAIFVIIAILIVTAILLLFLTTRNIPKVAPESQDFKTGFYRCARDSVEEAVDKMLPQGGFIDPENYKVYMSTKVSYLCQNIGYFKPCINQHPLLLNEEKNEIINYIQPKIQNCLDTAKKDFEDRLYNVEISPLKLNVTLETGQIDLIINTSVVISKDGSSERFDSFDILLNSPLYDLSRVAIEISSQEAKYCYFEYVGYMILYPKIKITKFTMSDSTKIYTIIDKTSKKVMNIATRGCVIPSGI